MAWALKPAQLARCHLGWLYENACSVCSFSFQSQRELCEPIHLWVTADPAFSRNTMSNVYDLGLKILHLEFWKLETCFI
jgi:hypothetical protein